jgi:hypothetical protein
VRRWHACQNASMQECMAHACTWKASGMITGEGDAPDGVLLTSPRATGLGEGVAPSTRKPTTLTGGVGLPSEPLPTRVPCLFSLESILLLAATVILQQDVSPCSGKIDETDQIETQQVLSVFATINRDVACLLTRSKADTLAPVTSSSSTKTEGGEWRGLGCEEGNGRAPGPAGESAHSSGFQQPEAVDPDADFAANRTDLTHVIVH